MAEELTADKQAIVALTAEVERLRAALTEREGECERLREDAARLDWLDKQSQVGGWYLTCPPPNMRPIFASLRAAIDSRMSADAARGPRTGGGDS